MAYEELTIEGRNAVIEAFRAGKTVDKIFVLEGCKDGPIQTVLREAKKQSTVVNFVKKERLDQLSETGKHQGVIAHLAAYEYSTVEEIMDRAAQKGEAPFVILLDGIETHTIWGLLFVLLTRQVHMVSSFLSDELLV